MNDKKAIEFLLRIFFQSLMNENFFHSLKKLSIDFLNWPSLTTFDPAKKFWKTAIEKGYNAAFLEQVIDIPEWAYREVVSEEEIKIFYSDYLIQLRTSELIKNLSLNPSNSIKLCSEFLENKKTISQKINLASAVGSFVEENELRIKNGDAQLILSDFPCLSQTIAGFNAGRITIVTAHTGFGKTNFGINILRAAINDNRNCLYINMEMNTVDMTKRFLQAFCKMNNYEFMQDDYIQKISCTANISNKLEKNWITDGSSMGITDISGMVSELKRTQPLDFVIVDYDQKIVMDSYGIREEWQAVKKAVEMLESIAKKESVHIIMFAQTNEDSDGLPIASKRSMQPASSVIQFTREEDQALLKFIKNRHGSSKKKIKLNYSPEKSFISEDGYFEEVLPQPNSRKNFHGRF